MNGKITESLNNVARTFALSKETEVYESIIDREDGHGSDETIIAHVDLLIDII